MEVIRLDPSLKKEAARVWTRSFINYPSMAFSWSDPEQRVQNLEKYFGWALNYGFRYGKIYTTPNLAGISVWLPPGQTHITTWRYILSGFIHLPSLMSFSEIFGRTLRNENAVHLAHKEIISDPHWYLWGVAVDPDHQGKGIGNFLLKPGLNRADSDQLPCYLETHDPDNISYYQKRGFDLIRSQKVPHTNLRFWCFLRQPRKVQDSAKVNL